VQVHRDDVRTVSEVRRDHAVTVVRGPGQEELGDRRAVRDGTFEVTVTKVGKPVAKVGHEYLSERAQGEFLEIHMKVTNIGTKAQTFDDSAQKPTRRAASSPRTPRPGSTSTMRTRFLEEIGPGNSVKGIVVSTSRGESHRRRSSSTTRSSPAA
jgi:hypothetical protein